MAKWTLLLVSFGHHSISGWEDIASCILGRAHHVAIRARDGELIVWNSLGEHLRLVNMLSVVRGGRHRGRILVVYGVGHRGIGVLMCALLGVCLGG